MLRFRPRPAPTIGAALGACLFASLGCWQLGRRAEAEVERLRFEDRLAASPINLSPDWPENVDWRRARVTGDPDWERYVLVVGSYDRMRPGYDLVVPVSADGGTVLVDVGWVPADGVEGVVLAEAAVEGPRTYEGLARIYAEDPAAAGHFPPEADGFRRYWRAISPRGMAQGAPVRPIVLTDGPGLAEAEVRRDDVPPVGGWLTTRPARSHGEYAATWFAILAMLIGLWVYGSVQPASAR